MVNECCRLGIRLGDWCVQAMGQQQAPSSSETILTSFSLEVGNSDVYGKSCQLVKYWVE